MESRKVYCTKMKREEEGFSQPPYPGELGKRIYNEIGLTAWKEWVNHQTMLINEYRLTPADPKARQFLEKEMEKFLFGPGSEKPKDYVEPDRNNSS